LSQLRRPLVVALLSFLAGLLPSLRFGPHPLLPGFAFLLVLATVGGGRLLSRKDWTAGHDRLLLPLLLISAGSLAGTLARADAALDCRASFIDGDVIRARGVITAAYRDDAGGGAPLIPILAEVGDTTACSGEIRVRMPPDQASLPVGSFINLRGRWRTFTTPVAESAWPRNPVFHGFLLADSAFVEADTPTRPSLWLRLRKRADQRLERIFPDHLPLVEALLLGRREYVDPEVRDRYTRSGLSHLLAISGMHVGLLAGAFLLLGSVSRLSRRRAVCLTIIATWIYLLVIGAPASALRSGTMISLGLLAFLLQRPAAATAIVAAAALVILAFRPLAILDPGFQLSFAGVLGILLLRDPLLTLAPDQLQRRGLLRGAFDAFVVGIAAFLMTAPIVAHHFGVIAPISIVVGVPAVPLMSLALIGAAAALVIDPLLPPLATLLASGAGLSLDALDWLAGFAASIPLGNGTVPKPPWWSWSIAAAVGLVAARSVTGLSRRLPWIAGVGSTIATLVVWPLAVTGASNEVEIHFVDVGQGDAIAIKTPGNRWILVDAGPASADFDAGEQRVLPFLRGHGARRIEAFVLTHPDLDHVGGAPAILSALPVGFVFEPGLAVGKSSYIDFLGALELRDTQWRAARAGRTMELDGVRFDFLWPDPETVDGASDANQISAVLRITYGDFAILLTGDAGADIEQLLVQRHGVTLQSQILKLGHHGSETSSDEAFLDGVRPELAVVSAGRRNRYGHPAAAVMDRLETRGIPVARTDQDGTVSVIVSEMGLDWRLQE
jgi:competence protein ComEC